MPTNDFNLSILLLMLLLKLTCPSDPSPMPDKKVYFSERHCFQQRIHFSWSKEQCSLGNNRCYVATNCTDGSGQKLPDRRGCTHHPEHNGTLAPEHNSTYPKQNRTGDICELMKSFCHDCRVCDTDFCNSAIQRPMGASGFGFIWFLSLLLVLIMLE